MAGGMAFQWGLGAARGARGCKAGRACVASGLEQWRRWRNETKNHSKANKKFPSVILPLKMN